MDSDSLRSLTELLFGSQPAQIRVAASTAIAAATAGDENAPTRAAVGAYPPVLRRLLALRGDVAAGRFALTALVNIAEDEAAARKLVDMRAVASASAALLDKDQRNMWSLHNALLANLTRIPEGVDALTGVRADFDDDERRVAEANLLRLATNLSGIPNALFLANACAAKRGREVLLSNDESDVRKQPLNQLLEFLSDGDKDRRLAAASALRNCALDEETHPALVGRTDVLGLALVRLMSPGRPVSESELAGSPKEVRAAAAVPMCLVPEPHAEIRLLIVEALLLLCQSLAGREALRKCNVYPILREWHMVETDEGVKEAVEQIVDRTQLLKEEADPEVGLKSPDEGATEEEEKGDDASKPSVPGPEVLRQEEGQEATSVLDLTNGVAASSLLDTLD